ncbi:hypothetical protein JCM11491_003519 [Sporobolomyces phaffii]
MQPPASFSFPPARNGQPNRPRPQRVNSNSHKAAPYQRPTSLASSTSSSASPAEGKWQHDLFGASSDLYKPSINVSHLAKLIPGSRPSASLRPFGDATPAPERLISTSTNPVAPPAAPGQSGAAQDGGQDLMTRLGIKGSSNHQAQQELQRQERERQRLERSEKVRIERERREQLRIRKELEKDYADNLRIAEFEETGFVVQVEGLVFGTSGEDVQTAFASYGEIKHCFIVNDKTAREGDQLTARITFSRHEDAKTACHKLDGAIADGRPLRVHHVPRSPFPAALPPLADNFASIPSGTTGVSNVPPTGPRGGPTGRGRGRGRMAPSTIDTLPAPVTVPAPAPVPIPSKMYADSIAEAYPVQPLPVPVPAVNHSMMDVDMNDSPVPTGPRRGGGRARDGARAGPAVLGRVQQPQPPAAAPVSLLDRMNGGGASTKAAMPATGRRGQPPPPSGPKSLAERMGQTAARGGSTAGANANARGKGARGNATAATTGGGGSLLNRLQ